MCLEHECQTNTTQALILKHELSIDADLNLGGDDVSDFEYHSNNLEKHESVLAVKALLDDHGFLPLASVTAYGPRRLLSIIEIDHDFVRHLVRSRKLPVQDIQNDLFRAAIESKKNMMFFKMMGNLGFSATKSLVDVMFGYRHDYSYLVGILEHIVPYQTLRTCAIRCVSHQLGQGRFSRAAVEFFIEKFALGHFELAGLILADKGGECRTRAFVKDDPSRCWIWILEYFGDNHPFSRLVMHDMIMWTAQSTNSQFSDIVVTLSAYIYRLGGKGDISPGHFRFLSQMALHQPTETVALRLAESIEASWASKTHETKVLWVTSVYIEYKPKHSAIRPRRWSFASLFRRKTKPKHSAASIKFKEIMCNLTWY